MTYPTTRYRCHRSGTPFSSCSPASSKERPDPAPVDPRWRRQEIRNLAASLDPGKAARASRTRPVYFLMYTTIVDGIIPARSAAASSGEKELWAGRKVSMAGTSHVLATWLLPSRATLAPSDATADIAGTCLP